ncbi:MAG: hypothetical protein ABR529_08405 [Actinomycetota bacterium]
MVGGSRPSENQVLRLFESRSYVEVHGRRIIVKKPDDQRRRAGL